jgi:DNA-binding LacI/PurR family transcriptional regulator
VAELTHPGLTTVALPAEEIASRAVRELDTLIREGAPVQPVRSVLPVRFIERGTTAPIAST